MSAARPLPRSLAAHPEESLAGYLLNLSARLHTSPAEAAVRVGLAASPNHRLVRVAQSLAVRIPPDIARTFADATRLTDTEVLGLTVARWDHTLLPDLPDPRWLTGERRAWLPTGSTTKACPECLGRTDGPQDEQGSVYATWMLWWRTPWAFACTAHRRLLVDRCPACATPLGSPREAAWQSGAGGHTGLVPSVGVVGLHPAACRARVGADSIKATQSKPCGHRLDQSRSRPTTPPQAVFSAQDHLRELVDKDPDSYVPSIGAPVTPAQYLRDVRLLDFALRTVEPSDWPLPPPTGTEAAVARAAQQVADGRASARTSQGQRQLWTKPPQCVDVTAASLTVAVALLAHPGPTTARAMLQPLVAAAARAEPLLWARIRNAASPSPRLSRFTSAGNTGTVSGAKLMQAGAAAPADVSSDHVPQLVDQATDALVAALAPGTSERERRRATALAMVRVINRCTLEEAASTLRMRIEQARAPVARLGRSLRDNGTDDDYRDLVAHLLLDIDPTGTNWGRRRHALREPWLIGDEDWSIMRQEMVANRAAQSNIDWTRRRISMSLLIWCRLTGGDHLLAPLAGRSEPLNRAAVSEVRRVEVGRIPRLRAEADRWGLLIGRRIDAGHFTNLGSPPAL